MKYQSGTTLISLLIGLLIAMLCIIAVLSSYRTIVKTGVESRVAATHDAQLQTGLATAQIFLQNAGFGLDGTNNLLIGKASIDVGLPDKLPAESAVLWRYKDNGKTICQGLADIKSSDGKKRRFVLLESNSPCDAPLNSDEVNWKIKSTLANLEDYPNQDPNQDPKQVTFKQTSSTCTPFGAGTLANTPAEVLANVPHPLITITAQTSTQQIAELGTVKVPVCLLNIISP